MNEKIQNLENLIENNEQSLKFAYIKFYWREERKEHIQTLAI
jgi:hypothetical protein